MKTKLFTLLLAVAASVGTICAYEVVIPSGTSPTSEYFQDLNVTSVVIGDNCTIGAWCFFECSNIQSIIVGDNCKFDGRCFEGAGSNVSNMTVTFGYGNLPWDGSKGAPGVGLQFQRGGVSSINIPCGTYEFYVENWSTDIGRETYCPYNFKEPDPIFNYSFTATQGGQVSNSPAIECDNYNTTLTATANYGYHFTKWNDGVTDNPRTITLTQDTTFVAEFEKNTYTVTTESNNSEWGTTFGDKSALYLDEIQISATPNYGYHFDHWVIEKYSEHIEYNITHNPYVVKFSVPESWSDPYAWIWETGREGKWVTLLKENDMYVYRTEEENRNIILVPDGASWSNGQTNDLAITESCCYTITGEKAGSNNLWTSSNYALNKTYDCLSSEEQTIITGIDTFTYVDTTNVSTSTQNPLAIVVTSNQKAIAHFAKNTYYIIKNAEHGNISGNSYAEYLDEVTLTVNADYGYHFTQWSDGETSNPRVFVITHDTTFTAEFAVDKSGKCGDGLALTWTYAGNEKALTISGSGTLNSNYTFGVEAPTLAEKLIIAEGVTSIGNSAFAGYSTLKHVSIAASVKTIYERAFYNCTGLQEIYSYREKPSNAYSDTFDGIDKSECTLHVLSSAAELYGKATGWRDFYLVEAIDAEKVTEEITDVKVEPTDNAVEVTWPIEEQAATYTLVISKDGVVFCTLTFNANGQLQGIAFAPSRNGSSHQAPAAVKTSNGGLRFTVTGLDSGTNYHLTLNAKDSGDQVIATYVSNFATSGISTGIEDVKQDIQVQKIMHDGNVYILRGDKTYTLQGQDVK